MAATFPTSVVSFTTKATNDVITDTFFNSPQEEITALETHLLSNLFSTVSAAGLPVKTSYTPTWGNTGTANTLGNATISGEYLQMGKIAFFTMSFVFGSTSVAGSGTFTFTTPVTSTGSLGAGAIDVLLADSSAGIYYRGAGASVSSTVFSVLATNSATPTQLTGVISTVPFTWATGDSVTVRGWCFVA